MRRHLEIEGSLDSDRLRNLGAWALRYMTFCGIARGCLINDRGWCRLCSFCGNGEHLHDTQVPMNRRSQDWFKEWIESHVGVLDGINAFLSRFLFVCFSSLLAGNRSFSTIAASCPQNLICARLPLAQEVTIVRGTTSRDPHGPEKASVDTSSSASKSSWDLL